MNSTTIDYSIAILNRIKRLMYNLDDDTRDKYLNEIKEVITKVDDACVDALLNNVAAKNSNINVNVFWAQFRKRI